MKNTIIYKTFEKLKSYDIDIYIETLFLFNENEWFCPTNKKDSHYTICNELFESGLISRKITPIWVNGSFKGNKIEFLYNKSLNF